jgi:hypothetical protein
LVPETSEQKLALAAGDARLIKLKKP